MSSDSQPEDQSEDEDKFIVTYIRIDPEECSSDDDEPDRFVRQITGKVLTENELGEVEEIGEFLLFFVDLEGAGMDEEHPFNVFDSYASTLDYYESLYTDDGLRDRVMTATGNEGFMGSLNVLIIEDLIIFPAARGAGRGLLALRALVHHFRGSVGLIVARPLPLQHFTHLEPTSDEYHRLGLYEFTSNAAASLKAVRRFFARFGFVRLLRTDLMLLNPGWPLPSVDELEGRPPQTTIQHLTERPAPPPRPVARIYKFPASRE